jgi:hypothetical protein
MVMKLRRRNPDGRRFERQKSNQPYRENGGAEGPAWRRNGLFLPIGHIFPLLGCSYFDLVCSSFIGVRTGKSKKIFNIKIFETAGISSGHEGSFIISE